MMNLKRLKKLSILGWILMTLLSSNSFASDNILLRIRDFFADTFFQRGEVAENINDFTRAPSDEACNGVDPLAFSNREISLNEILEPPEESPPLTRGPSRGLLEFPTAIESAAVGPCESRHYNPDGNRVDQYIAPHTGCAFAAVLQEWNEACPGFDSACRLAWGDISHRTESYFNGHRSHTGGECIDMRPIRNTGGGPLTYRHHSYDRERTQQLINLLKEKGGTAVLFNDPQINGATDWAGHDNHIHVCFRNDVNVKDACRDLEPDYNRCPMLYNFLESDEVRSIRDSEF